VKLLEVYTVILVKKKDMHVLAMNGTSTVQILGTIILFYRDKVPHFKEMVIQS
jgi:hypothetical protein